MGLAVAQALEARGGWKINLIDIKDDEGRQASDSLSNTTYHRANLLNYEEVTAAFKNAFTAGNNRLDFVFANAGVVESTNVFTKHESLDGPPPPDLTALEVNLKSCINAVHVGRHYINLSPDKGSIVINASCSSFWPTYWAPVYTASKCMLHRPPLTSMLFEGILMELLTLQSESWGSCVVLRNTTRPTEFASTHFAPGQ